MSGNLTFFSPGSESAGELCKATHQYYLWKLAAGSNMRSRDGDGDDDSKKGASGSDWMDLIGSAGMVMGAIKKTDKEQGKMVITIQNSSPHVVVPYKVQAPTSDFYARSGLCLMTPGDSTQVEFDVNYGFEYSRSERREFYVHFAVVASNGKSTKCYLHFDALDGEYFVPVIFNAKGYGSGSFTKSSDEKKANFNQNYLVAADGDDDSPSFALSMMKVPVDAEEDTSKVGFVISPWKVGTEHPSSGLFEFPKGERLHPTLYADTADGAVDVGKMAWNYLKRSSGDLDAILGSKSRGLSVGGFGSFITMGVNLLMGARNLRRKDKSCHNIEVCVKNMTSHTLSVIDVQNSENCFVENSLIPPHGEGTVNLGTRDFAGSGHWTGGWPSIGFSMSNGEVGTAFDVSFMDTSVSDRSGQIRVRHITQNAHKAVDRTATNSYCNYLFSSFFTSMGEKGRPQFLMMSAPVGKGDADFTIVFIN